MEQLKTTITNDNDRMFKILTDLINAKKEFQIMITVPGNMTESNENDSLLFVEAPFRKVRVENRNMIWNRMLRI